MKNELFNELLESMHEMDRIVHGGVSARQDNPVHRTGGQADTREYRPQPEAICYADWREQTHTGKNWEQGRRTPAGPARALLKILHADPEHALRALHGQADVA